MSKETKITKKFIKKMMKTIGQDLIYEEDKYLEYDQEGGYETICFRFNEEGFLEKIFS